MGISNLSAAKLDEICFLNRLGCQIEFKMLEDEPLFNAGIGSVLAADGSVTMDASIMNGFDSAAGSVVNVTNIRHPIRAAKKVLEKGWPVMLNSKGAEDFALGQGVEKVSQDWLITDLRKAQWQKWKDNN